MTNEHYLIASYLVSAGVCLSLGVAADWVLRNPVTAISEAAAVEKPSPL
jgi:hypothetical protein